MDESWVGVQFCKQISYQDDLLLLKKKKNSQSDVWRGQILRYKDGPRTERVKKIFSMVVDP